MHLTIIFLYSKLLYVKLQSLKVIKRLSIKYLNILYQTSIETCKDILFGTESDKNMSFTNYWITDHKNEEIILRPHKFLNLILTLSSSSSFSHCMLLLGSMLVQVVLSKNI